MAISPARLSAYDILLQVERGEGSSSELLAEHAERLEERDRGLSHELTLGVLRRQMYLDRITDVFSRGKKLDVEVRCALRLGLYQLIYLDRVPAYSAINDSVELVKRAKKVSARGFVNALLRRATREVPELTFSDELGRISVQSSHPRWLVEKWAGTFGIELAEQIATANNDLPKVAFRLTARGISSPTPELSAFIWDEMIASDRVGGCYTVDRFSQRLRDLEASGLIYFQDEASQMAANAASSKQFSSFLDVCAAPGGKTTQIAARSRPDVLIVAGDISNRRTDFLKYNCLGQGAENVRVVQFAAETPLPFSAGTFDAVFVDAPCSGTGTIRHNPEIRYRLAPDDFFRFAGRQLSILGNAAALVAPGGSLIYSTCSLEPEENEDVVKSFMATCRGFTSLRPAVPSEFVTTDGFARTYPSRDDMDGFFIAAFERKES